MIVTIASQKGGVGKSTVAMNLALGVAGLKKKYTVALLDADQQKSCYETLQNHQKTNLSIHEAAEKPHRIIEQLDQQIIFIDTPPHSHEIIYQAAAVSDIVLIPLQPSPLDIRGVAKTVKALTIIQEKMNPELQCRFLINRITPRTILANEIRSALQKYYPFPILKCMLHNREAYKQSLITGTSVMEYNRSSLAAQEMEQLLIEIAKMLKLKRMKK